MAKVTSKKTAKVAAKKTAAKKTAAKSSAAKKTAAKTKAKATPAKKTAAKVAASKVAASKSAEKSTKKTAAKASAKKVASKATATAKSPTAKKTVAKKTASKVAAKTSAKPTAKKATKKVAKKTTGTDVAAANKVAASAAASGKEAAETKQTRPSATDTVKETSIVPAADSAAVVPYERDKNSHYMDQAQLEHFSHKLAEWKQQLMEEVDRTVGHMKDDATNFPDPNDRATQEEEFSLELRTRDRERKLIKKINEAQKRIEEDEYGYCETCGIEIGVSRLEARPTAELCIDCKTLEEIRERQIA